jgi:hypothetical protein
MSDFIEIFLIFLKLLKLKKEMLFMNEYLLIKSNMLERETIKCNDMTC